jgi:hypothetical protein
MLQTHRNITAYCATLWWRWLLFFTFFRVLEHRWNEIDKGKPKYSGKKPVPVTLCLPQIAHGLIRNRTRASAVGRRRLTAWAMVRPADGVTHDYEGKPLTLYHQKHQWLQTALGTLTESSQFMSTCGWLTTRCGTGYILSSVALLSSRTALRICVYRIFVSQTEFNWARQCWCASNVSRSKSRTLNW